MKRNTSHRGNRLNGASRHFATWIISSFNALDWSMFNQRHRETESKWASETRCDDVDELLRSEAFVLANEMNVFRLKCDRHTECAKENVLSTNDRRWSSLPEEVASLWKFRIDFSSHRKSSTKQTMFSVERQLELEVSSTSIERETNEMQTKRFDTPRILFSNFVLLCGSLNWRRSISLKFPFFSSFVSKNSNILNCSPKHVIFISNWNCPDSDAFSFRKRKYVVIESEKWNRFNRLDSFYFCFSLSPPNDQFVVSCVCVWQFGHAI